MSLMRLLSVSNSFLARKDQMGRYRLPTQAMLPRFGAPDSGRPDARPDLVGARPAGERKADRVRRSLPASVLPLLPAARMAVSRTGEAFSFWKKWLGPKRRAAVRAASTAAASFRPVQAGAEARQAELSLESVRVVRNDLSDSDFQVLPGKGISSGFFGTVGRAGARADLGGFRRLAGRAMELVRARG